MTEATLSPEFLARMDEAICDEFEKCGRLRRILPAEVDMPHARYGLVIPQVVDNAKNGASATTNVLRPPITLERSVMIPARQLEDIDLICQLVRDATKRICAAEDRIIAYGGILLLKNQDDKLGVEVNGLGKETLGLLGPGTIANAPIDVTKTAAGELLTELIQIAASELDTNDPPFYPPYGAALAPPAWKVYVPSSDDDKDGVRAALHGDRLAPIVGSSSVLCDRDPGKKVGDLLDAITIDVNDAGTDNVAKVITAVAKQVTATSGSDVSSSALYQAVGQFIIARIKVDSLLADAKTAALDAVDKLRGTKELCPFASVFSSDPVDLDLARVRRPWGSPRGHGDDGNLRYRIESQFLLRIKRRNAVYAIWQLDALKKAYYRRTLDEEKGYT